MRDDICGSAILLEYGLLSCPPWALDLYHVARRTFVATKSLVLREELKPQCFVCLGVFDVNLRQLHLHKSVERVSKLQPQFFGKRERQGDSSVTGLIILVYDRWRVDRRSRVVYSQVMPVAIAGYSRDNCLGFGQRKPICRSR